MFTHISSAFWLKGATTRSFMKGATTRSFRSSAFLYSALLLSHSIFPKRPPRTLLSPITLTLTRSPPQPPTPVLPRRSSSDLRCCHLLLLAGLGTGLLLRPSSPLAAGGPLLALPSSSVLPPLAAPAGPSSLRLPPPSYSLLPPRVTPPSPSCPLHFDLVG